MADSTGIEWTEVTWNPTVGCSVISPGCTNCYAMKMAARIEAMGGKSAAKYAGLTKPSKAGAVWTGAIRLDEASLGQPLRWNKPRRIFVNSMSDLFHEGLPDEAIDKVFAVMALAPQHTFQVLTKRAKRMRDYLLAPRRGIKIDRLMASIGEKHGRGGCLGELPLANVWLGVSAEDQKRADERVPDLLATPAMVRFVSAEPLLGPLDLVSTEGGTLWMGGQRGCDGTHRHGGDMAGHSHGPGTSWFDGDPRRLHHHHDERCGPGLDWVIAGGESGPGARPMHPDWARTIRDQCAAAGVAFFMKQMTGKAPIPADLQVRQFPDQSLAKEAA